LVRTLIHALPQYRPEEIEEAFLHQQLFANDFGIPFPIKIVPAGLPGVASGRFGGQNP